MTNDSKEGVSWSELGGSIQLRVGKDRYFICVRLTIRLGRGKMAESMERVVEESMAACRPSFEHTTVTAT